MCKGQALHSRLRPSTEGLMLSTGLGGVTVWVWAAADSVFLFTLVCWEARKKISSCKALDLQKFCCLTPLHVQLDVSPLLPSSVPAGLLHVTGSNRCPEQCRGNRSILTCSYNTSESHGGNKTQQCHRKATWRSGLVSAPVLLEKSAFAESSGSPVWHCGALCLTPWEIPRPVPPYALYKEGDEVSTLHLPLQHTCLPELTSASLLSSFMPLE